MHHVPIGELHIVPEAERIRSEEVNMQIARNPVLRIFEVMVLDICQTVAHDGLAGPYLAAPDHLAGALHPDLAGNMIESRIDDQLRTDRARPELRMGEIQIVSLFEPVIRELVAHRHANAARETLRIDEVDARYLRFLAAVLGEFRNFERFAVRPEDASVSLVKPLWSGAGLSGGRLPALHAPAIHPHAVCLLLNAGVHGVPALNAGEVREAGA